MTNLLRNHWWRLAQRMPAMSLVTFFIAFAVAPLISRATNVTLEGTFSADDNVQLFSVSIATPAAVDIRSYGYAGGTTSTGTVISPGGFDTILTLFDTAGAFLTDNDEGAGVAVDPTTGLAADARITTTLTPGNYIVALTEFDSFSIGDLADGFAETGNPHFTADPSFTSGGPCPGDMFRDISGTAGRCRTGNFALDFVNVASATTVPEPSPLLLTAAGLGLLLVARFRLRRRATALVGVFVAALANAPLQAQTQTGPGPDYTNVTDFLNGERTLLNITDLQVFRQSMSTYNWDDGGVYMNHSNQVEMVQIVTGNSQQNAQTPIVHATDYYADSTKPIFSVSAFMFANNKGASTLTTMGDFNHSGTLALWLQNVDALGGNPGWWTLTNSGDNPNVTSVAVADFTEDGYDDVALSFDDGRLFVLTPNDVNDVFKNFKNSITPLVAFKAMAGGDFLGDGRREIAGLSVDPATGGLKLAIYTVDPSSLAAAQLTSLALALPQGVSASNPITYVSMARGRFNNAGHDQLAITFANTGGSPIVEVVDIALKTTNLVEGPRFSPTSVPISVGYLEVQTGKFALPGNPYDEIVFHMSSTASSGGRFFEILSADPTSLVLTAHSGVGYDGYGCAAGIRVGNFDHRQQSDPNQHNPNDQVAFMFCAGQPPSSNYPMNGYVTFTINIYSADPATLNLNAANPDSSAFVGTDIWLNGSATATDPTFKPVTVTFVATDLTGRSLTLGEPTKVTIQNTIQPSVIVGVPPMHVDFIDPGDGNGPRVFNVSVVPDSFKTAYNQQSSSSYASSTTNTTSWSFGAKETGTAGFTIGDPDVTGLKVSDTFTAAQDLKGSHEHDHGTYNGTSFNLSATTGFGDQVSYVDSQFNIWIYPVIGGVVCPAPPTACPKDGLPLTLQFSAPDGNSQQPESVEGQALQWYQPPWEPGNIFSYPANFDQLKAHYPDAVQMTNDTTGFLTDGSTITQTATWSGSGEESDSTGFEQNYSFENDFSVNGAIEFAGIGTEGSYGLDVSGSFGFNNLFKSTTTLGKSTGLEISKPGTFPAFQNYGYSVKPYIVGTMQPGGVVDGQQVSADIQTVGLLRAVFTADPVSQDPPAGGWWQQAYTAAPDVALNHPSRWTYTALSVPTNGDLPTNCLAVGDGRSMDCAELNTRSPNNPWLDIFHYMRGFFISGVNSPGKGPQLEQAKAGDVLTLQTRVYNYSLTTMPAGTEVHVRFYFMPWNTTRNLPAETNGNSYLINEEKVAAIPPFNESTGPNAQPNWTLVSTTFDTTKFQETMHGNANVVFWVVVWMQDGSGNLISEMPGHGLTAIPPAGTPNSVGETTVQFSGTQANPGVAQSEECQPADQNGNVSCYGNNLGLYKQVFFIAPPPNQLGGGPGSGNGTVDIGKIDVSADQITPTDTDILSATLSVSGAAVSGVGVNFYDGDPEKGGQLFAVERVPYIARDAQYLVQTTYKSNACGVHQLFAVVNKGKPSQVVRRAHPVRVDGPQCTSLIPHGTPR